MIIAVISPKGGAGKTTLAIGAIVEVATNGDSVLAINCDTITQLLNWNSKRTEQIDDGVNIPEIKTYEASGFGELEPMLIKHADKYDYIFIDTPGTDSGNNRAALLYADLVLLPTGPGGTDVKALSDLFQLVNSAKKVKPNLNAFIVPVNLNTNHRVIKEEIDMFKDVSAKMGVPLFPGYTQHRISHQKCTLHGLGPQEMPNGKDAKLECADIYSGILEIEAALVAAQQEDMKNG